MVGIVFCAATLSLVAGRTQVYVADGSCAVARYAAGELGGRLSQVFGAEVPVTNVFLDGFTPIVVGDNALSRTAGIDVDGLPRDAGVIRIGKDRVYIAGSDDRVKNDRQVREALSAGIWANMYERATEFAVYEFLERYAGIRFYFPGRLGTVVPRRTSLELPVGVVTNAPDFAYRDYALWETGDWYEDETRKNGRGLVHHTHRLLTEFIPCSHGLNEFSYLKRFGETHPEYFQMMEDGRRNVDPKFPQPGQLCHSSKVWDEIYEDVKSFFLGEPAETRGVLAVGYPGGRGKYGWNCNTKEIKGLGKFADVMPQDAFRECHCEACQKAYRKDRGASYATDLIWGNVIRLCNRLKAAGIEGTVTMMGYAPYKDPPEGPLPDNLRVMVARGGPWQEANPTAVAREKDEIRAWAKKLGQKVWLWNYPCKFRGEFPAIPEHCPHAWAKYYQDLSPDIFGAFAQNTTTQFLYAHLNTYVYSRLCWDNKADVDEILEEYYTLMYGPGRDEMKAFFETLEDKWMHQVVGKMVDTPLGPVPTQPSDYEMFNRIYSPADLRRLVGLLRTAAKKAGEGTIEAERIALMRRVVFNPMARRAQDYLALTDVRQGLARRAARKDAASVVLHDGFDTDLTGWNGKGEIVRDTSPTDGGCVRIVAADPKGGGIYRMLNAGALRLKPNTKYRLSYFVRYENVVPAKKGGGVYSNVWTEGQNWYPVNHCGHTGTAGWIYQEQTFVSRPEKGEYGGYDACSISLCLRDATGTAWFDDVLLEELGAQ